MHLAINKVCMRAALRISTLPATHPLAKYASRAARIVPKKHQLPLHKIFQAASIQPTNMETIKPIRHTSKWTPPNAIHIASSKQVSIEEERDDDADICVYSDGSGIDGHIGAAAVLYRWRNNRTTKKVLRYCLGPDTKHTVFEGEVVGKILGQQLVYNELSVGSESMYVDNQASILATQSIKPTPGHYLVDIFHAHSRHTKKKHTNARITVRWIAAHNGVEGNKEVDKEAKKAA